MKISHLCTAILIALSAMSCSTQRSPLPYFLDIDSLGVQTIKTDYQIHIEPSDELHITVNSANPQATALYNLPVSNPGSISSLGTTTQPQQQTYVVDTSGNIQFPELGKLHVEGLTIEQLQAKLTDLISQDVQDPVVRVELVNFKVDVAGEVKNPGTIEVKNRRFSVLDALTAAGDLTEYAQRDNVLVVREQNGKRTYGRINLNSAESLSSPYFYLKQNDYVYVEPNKIRQDNSKYNMNNSYKLSVISTIVSGCSVVCSLIIALTRR